MFKIIAENIILFALFVAISVAEAREIRKCDPAKGPGLVGYLADRSGKVTSGLKELVQKFGLKETNTLSAISEETKRAWYRPKGTERWQIQEKYESEKLALAPYFEKVGMLCKKDPKEKHYENVLLLGGLLSRVRIRLAYLSRQWERGIRFDSIALLGCERLLDPKLENREMLLKDPDSILPNRRDWKAPPELPKNEIEMMKYVYDQAALPPEMRKVKLVLVNSPSKKDADGKETRAETEDTIITWLETKPTSGKVLSLSNQPFIGYQHEKVRKYLPKEFILETVGPGLKSTDIKVGVLLDNLARWLNQLTH